ncbi:MAG TPA: hypothetical protein VMT12_00530 [Syntrophales bacterium]|nr:hypothetical protein [Syntrophales bacterium]
MNQPYKVMLIVEPAYGERLAAVPPHVPVWIIENDLNTPVVRRLRQERHEENHLTGITTFKQDLSLSPEEQAIAMLAQVDLHHGEFSADPPYSILEVIGCTSSDDVRHELQQYGFGISEITKEGFIATRTEEAQQGRCT